MKMSKILTIAISSICFSNITYCQFTFPETPAGNLLKKVVSVINTGDIDKIKSFIDYNHTESTLEFFGKERLFDMYYQIYVLSNGLDLNSMIENSERRVVAVFSTRMSDTGYEFGITADLKNPGKILGYTIMPKADINEETVTGSDCETHIITKLGKILDDFTSGEIFSGIVLIAKADKIIYNKSYGLADRESGMPINSNTKFNLASVNKMFTAVAIAQLCEKGKLSYNDSISKFLGADWISDEIGNKVKIKHLLTHTSGLGGGDFNITYVETAVKNGYNEIDDYKSMSADFDLHFEPGEKYEYSNLGYHLLGAIIEKASGMSYYDYIRLYIFEPAEMIDAGFPIANSDLNSMAIGYEKIYKNETLLIQDNKQKVNIKGSPAGLAYATVTDMFHFAQAMKNNKLVTPETKEVLFTPKEELNAQRYGYGFQIRAFEDSKLVCHTGGYIGINNVFSMDLDHDITLIVLSNHDNVTGGIVSELELLIYEITECLRN